MRWRSLTGKTLQPDQQAQSAIDRADLSGESPMSEHLDRRANELDELTMKDATRNALVAGSSGIPVVGPLVAILLDKYMPEQRARRLITFVQDLKERLDEVADEVDERFTRSPEFEGLVEEVLETVMHRRSEAKQRHYAGVIASSALKNRPDEDERFRLLDTLDRMRESHVRLLEYFARVPYTNLATFESLGAHISQEVQLQPDALRRDWEDLATWHLVKPESREPNEARTTRVPSAEITNYGRAFLRFVEGKPVPSGPPQLVVTNGPENQRVRILMLGLAASYRIHLGPLSRIVKQAGDATALAASLAEYGSSSGLGTVVRAQTEESGELVFEFRADTHLPASSAT
jgi:hypothetical protein